MTDKLKKEVGARLAQCRNNHRLTLDEAAAKIGASGQQLNNWERGIRPVSIEYMHKLAALFNVGFGWLGGADEPAERAKGPMVIISDNLMLDDLKKGDEVEIDQTITEPSATDMFAIDVNGQTWVRWISPGMDGSYTVSASDTKRCPDEKFKDLAALKKLNIIGRVHSIKRYT